MTKKPTLLVILDGFGYNPDRQYNAIAQANTPNWDGWLAAYPHAYLAASGTAVGLTPNTIGTSEVGHQTIGAGRVIPESIVRINEMIANGSFATNPALVTALAKLKTTGGRLHFMGLLSDGGVHSHENHLFALLEIAHKHGIATYVHAFLDGRDVPPRSAELYLAGLARELKKFGGHIGSIHGRFYAMDRDKNWERTEQTYRVLTQPQATNISDYHAYIGTQYTAGITDEFMPPVQCDPHSVVRDGDGVIFFNFRADRARQLTRCFVAPSTVPFKISPLKLAFFLGMTDYDHDVSNACLLTKEPITNTLKERLAAQGKTIFTIAETEKYAHVTYFFGGGKEAPFPGEQWVLIPSLKAKNYVAHPAMSAHEITDAVIKSLKFEPCDFYVINYANADMVAHSGDFEATIKAVECLDSELKRLFDVAVQEMHGTMYITADHGNAELMFDEQSLQPKTAHTLNPVPFVMLRNGLTQKTLPLRGLADIADFVIRNLS